MSSSSTSSDSLLTSILHNGIQYALNLAVYMFAAIVLLNTVGLISVALADTMQYPVTASIAGSLIPPGESSNYFL